jgi:hypothetical protein
MKTDSCGDFGKLLMSGERAIELWNSRAVAIVPVQPASLRAGMSYQQYWKVPAV